jgi:hypothetical protein
VVVDETRVVVVVVVVGAAAVVVGGGGGAVVVVVGRVDGMTIVELVVAELPEQAAISKVEARNKQVLRTSPR